MKFSTINIGPLFLNDQNAKRQVARQIDEACRKSGFFMISNHGVDNLNQVWQQTTRFFQTLTADEKQKLAAAKWNPQNKNSYRGFFPSSTNGKEGFDIGNPTIDENHSSIRNKLPLHEVCVWPDENTLPGFREFFTEYYAKMIHLARVLLRGFALALEKEETFFDDKVQLENTMSTLRLNYYPFSEHTQPVEIAPDGTKLGCETHKDGCLITILFQPEVGGLQVEDDGMWSELQPSDTNFVVNTGVCMSKWSNNLYNAANHRVRMSNQQRISVPFFVEHSPNTIIQSAVESRYKVNQSQIKYLDYIMESNKRFKEYQR